MPLFLILKYYKMRKLIVSMNVTLDGFMSGPKGELNWHFPLFTEEMSRTSWQQLLETDTVLLGRKTFERMACYWSKAAFDKFGEIVAAHQKIVFSKTVIESDLPNCRFVSHDLVKETAWLKHQKGKDIIVFGSGTLIPPLCSAALVDEFRIWLHPVSIGKGVKFFNDDMLVNLDLMSTKAFASGVVLLSYRNQLTESYQKRCVN
jgi:dihydrofolate reductase